MSTNAKPLGELLDEIEACAKSWYPEAMLMGNVRAADFIRLVAELRRAMAIEEAASDVEHCLRCGYGKSYLDEAAGRLRAALAIEVSDDR